MVNAQTVAYRLFLIIFALNQGFSRVVVYALGLRWVVGHMIDAPRTRMHTASTQTLHYLFVLDGNFQHMINRNVCIYDRLSLGNRAWKAVKQKTVSTVVFSNAFLHQRDNQIV